MSIKSISGVQSSPVPDAIAPVSSAPAATPSQLPTSGPADFAVPPTAAGQVASMPGRAALTVREIELRHAIPKDTSLQSRLPGIVAPVVRADVDYLQMAAEASIDAQQARESTDRMLDTYVSSALKKSPLDEPALEQQLWASIAFEFDHLQAQSDALAGLQKTNRTKLDHLQRAISNGLPEPTLIEHLRQAQEFDQKLGKKRDEVDLSIACRDAVLEARLVKLGLLRQE
jgi:hypothetical protein